MPVKVVVIEDVSQIRENIADILHVKGYMVQTAENGAEGIYMVNNWHPDVLLCDIMMPVMDGYQVLETIRANAATANLPFIFLTAKTDMVDLRKGMRLGADDYLIKPFLATDLVEAIESRLKRFHGQQSLGEPTVKTIHGKDAKGCTYLPIDECNYFFVENRDYFVQHPSGTFQISQTLEKLMTLLPAKLFFRINRHLIINRNIVQKYAYWEKGKYCLYLEGRLKEAFLPKSRFKTFKKWLSGYA